MILAYLLVHTCRIAYSCQQDALVSSYPWVWLTLVLWPKGLDCDAQEDAWYYITLSVSDFI